MARAHVLQARAGQSGTRLREEHEAPQHAPACALLSSGTPGVSMPHMYAGIGGQSDPGHGAIGVRSPGICDPTWRILGYNVILTALDEAAELQVDPKRQYHSLR